MNALPRLATVGLAALTLCSLGVSPAQATPISATVLGYDLMYVGDSGNTAQSGATGTGSENQNGFGAVATDFWIGKNQVTIGQYTEFLNAVAKTNDRGLYNAAMNSDQRIRGIEQSGTDGAWVYSVVGPNGTNTTGATSPANRPITYVSWFDSARFANWMANGKPTGAAGSTTDNGAYNLGDTNPVNAPALNATNPNTGAVPTFSIPTENQWYKAAYYSPVKVAESTPGYFLYGTGSDATPGNGWNDSAALANKELVNQANYRLDGSRYAVTGTTTTILSSSNQNLLTDVGGFTNTYSYYGAFDMSGNAWDWNDLDGVAGSSRGIRGGSWSSIASLSSADRLTAAPSLENSPYGFRLASSVPEPATLGMTSVGALCACGWWILKRRRRART